MEPMNAFLTGRRQEFKDFVDKICGISPDRATSAIPASYATPITILGRLPATSREGFPSLPYLIDQARECAGLVEIWLNSRHEVDGSFAWSDELKSFDALCGRLRQRTKDALSQAEQAERPSGAMAPKWEELVDQMERRAKIGEQSANSSPGTPVLQKTSNTVNSSTSSLGDSYFSRHAVPPKRSPPYEHTTPTKSTRNTIRSRDGVDQGIDYEETDTPTSPPVSSSAVWDPGVTHRRPSAIKPTTAKLSPHSNNRDYEHSLSLTSSTFSLDASTDRAHAGSTEPLSPLLGSDSDNEAPATGKSLYSLTSPPQPHKNESSSRSKPASRDGGHEHSSHRRYGHEPRQKSMYRLPNHNSSNQTADAITPRSVTSRDGKEKGFLFADFGSVFRKKAKEREHEERGSGKR